MNHPSENQDPLEDGILCPSCLTLNETHAASCAKCGAPIGVAATLDPLQQIHAEGFGFRSAAEGPPRLIVLIGIWMIFLPMFVLFSSVLITRRDSSPDLLSLLLAVVSPVMLYRVTKNYFSKREKA